MSNSNINSDGNSSNSFFRLEKACGELLSNNNIVVIAIDGMSGAGKTTISNHLSKMFEGQVIHCDDFFLPPQLRNNKRLSEPGGNIDYQRMKTQVIEVLKGFKESEKSETFAYGRFDCKHMKITENINIPASRLYIVEGAYALHPYYGKYYDISVYMRISGEEQINRIANRGNDVTMFVNKWIPMENAYDEAYSICDNVDMIIEG